MINPTMLARLAQALPAEQEPMQLAQGMTPMDIYRQDGYSSQTSDPKTDLAVIQATDPRVGQPVPAAPPAGGAYKPGAAAPLTNRQGLIRQLMAKEGISEAEANRRVARMEKDTGLRVRP